MVCQKGILDDDSSVILGSRTSEVKLVPAAQACSQHTGADSAETTSKTSL